MTEAPSHTPDEFEERARRVAEAQEVARDYSGLWGRAAVRAFTLGFAGILLLLMVWILSTWHAASDQPNLAVEEVREHLVPSR